MSRKSLSLLPALFLLCFVSVTAFAQSGPTCIITSPQEGTVVQGLVTISALVTDSQGPSGIASVSLRVNQQDLAPVSSNYPSYVFNWDASALPDKGYDLEVIARNTLSQVKSDSGYVILDNPPANTGSVSGIITYTGGQQGPIYALLCKDPAFQGGMDYVTLVDTMTGVYGLPFVSTGTWYFIATKSTNGDKVTKTDAWGIYGTGSPTPIVVASVNIPNVNVTLTDGSEGNPNPLWSDAYYASAQTWHHQSGDECKINLSVKTNTNVIGATVSGPGITGQLALTFQMEGSDKRWANYYTNPTTPTWYGFGSRPAAPLYYTFTITEPTTTYYKYATATKWVDYFATLNTPALDEIVAGLVPTFTWYAPIGEVANYSIEVNDDYMMNRMWSNYNIPAGQTSVVYNFDSAGQMLYNGMRYNWGIQVRDNDDNGSMGNWRSFYTPGGGQQTKKLSGYASYNGSSGGAFEIYAGIGNPPIQPVYMSNQWVKATASLPAYGGSFSIDVPTNGDYYLIAFKDDNPYNNGFNSPEANSIVGPYYVYDNEISGINITVDASGSGQKGFFGTVNYSGQERGNVRISVWQGSMKPTGTQGAMANTMINYATTNYYQITVPNEGMYWIGSYMDLNMNSNMDAGEPTSGDYIGPIYISFGMYQEDLYLYSAASNNAPVCSITSPSNMQVVNGLVTISATATDDMALNRVELTIRGKNETKYQDYYSGYDHVFYWDSTFSPDQVYTIEVVAYDNYGAKTSQQVDVILNNGNNTGSVAGTITYPGSQTGQIYACLSSTPTFKMQNNGPEYYMQVSTTNGQYTLPAVRSGIWYSIAVMMTGGNDSGNFNKTDPWGVYGTISNPTPINVQSTPINGVSYAMADGDDAQPNPFYYDRQAPRAYSKHFPTYYSASFNVYTSTSVTAVTVAGLGLSGSINLTKYVNQEGPYWNSSTNQEPTWTTTPATPMTYTFTFTEPTNTYTKTAQVTAFVQEFASPIAPMQNEMIYNLNPMLMWNAPSTFPVAWYDVEVRETQGQFMWRNDSDIPSSQTNVMYNFDNNGSQLMNGKQYNWNVTVHDQDGNQSFSPAWNFSTPGSGVTRGISGNVSYYGAETGQIYVIAGVNPPPMPPVSLNSPWQVSMQEMSTPSAYSMNVPYNSSNFYVLAFMDVNSNGRYDTGEPSAQRGPIYIYDNINPGNYLELFGTGIDNAPQCKITSPVSGVVSGLVTISATASDDKGITAVMLGTNENSIAPASSNPPNYVFVWNTNNASGDKTYYLKLSAYDSASQSAGDSILLTVNNGSNTGAVSGTLSYSGSQTGTMIACLSSSKTFISEPEYYTVVATGTGNFSIQGVKPGAWYFVGMLLTQGLESGPQKYDPWKVYGSLTNPTTIYLTTTNQGIGILSLVDGTDANPNPFYTDRSVPKAKGMLNGWDNNRFTVSFDVTTSTKVTSVTVTGSAITTPVNLTAGNRTYTEINWRDTGNTPKWVSAPATPMNYTFSFIELTTTYSKSAQVLSFVTKLATLLTPSNNMNLVDLNPTFSWTAPQGTAVSRYGIYVYEQGMNGPNQMWYKDNIPGGQTSINYNADGQAVPLMQGKTYNWQIRVYDANESESNTSNFIFYTPGGSSQRGIAGNLVYGGTDPGQLHVLVGYGNPPAPPLPLSSTWEQRRVDLNSPGTYMLNLTSNDGNYYILAFKDINMNNTFDQGEPSGIRGPIDVWDNISAGNDLNLGGVQVMGGKIEGTLNYPEATRMNGNLWIMCSASVPGSGVTPARAFQMSNPIYPFHYVLDGLDAGTYYVFAYVDSNPPPNGNGTYEDGIEPRGIYGNYNSTSGQFDYSPVQVIYNQSTTGIPVDIRNPSGTGGTTGNNTVKGNVTFAQGGTGRLVMRIGFGDNLSIYDQKAQTDRPSLGFYEFRNLPDGQNYKLEAFLDYNYNWFRDVNEPQYYSPNFISLSGAITQNINVELTQQQVQESTITVTIRGKVFEIVGSSEVPVSGAAISMYDPGGYNDNDPSNDKVIGTAVSNAIFNTGDNEWDKYNFEITNVQVKTSELSNYNYSFKVIKAGYRTSWSGQSFWNSDAGQKRYVWVPALEFKPVVSIGNLQIIPASRIITPDYDGIDDQAKISFKYSVTASNSWGNGANVRLVIDTNKDGNYASDWGIWINVNGKDYVKWDYQNNQPDPSAFIDFSNPDYSKLKGPLSQDERQRIQSQYDVTMENYIDDWSLMQEGNKWVNYVEMVWEGRDSSWNPLKPDTYIAKLIVGDQDRFDPNVLTYSTTFYLTVQAKAIKGRVLDANQNPIVGSKVNVYGPNGGMSFTDSNGYYVVSGIRAGDSYSIEASAERCITGRLDNIQFPTGQTELVVSTITLTAGTKVSGIITLPNPPKAGTVADTYSGNMLMDLWGGVEVPRIDGPGYNRVDVRIPLSNTILAEVTSYYELYVAPGTYEIRVQVPGYTSMTEQFVMAATPITKNLTLTKSATVKGFIRLPAEATTQEFFNQLRMTKGYSNVWINVNAESLDHKNNSGCGFEFREYDVLQGATTNQFVLSTLIPNTSYYLRFESNGIFASKQISIFSGAGDTTLPDFIDMEFGGTLTGTVRIIDDVISQIEDYGGYDGPMVNGGFDTTGLKRLQIGVMSLNDYSWNGTDVWISTMNFPVVSSYTIRGLSSGKYKIELNNIRGVDIQPVIDSRVVTVSTSGAGNNVVPFDITIRLPSGKMSGLIKNSCGSTIDYSSSTFAMMIAYPNGKGEPIPVTIIPNATNNDAGYWADGLQTGEAVIWGNEYSEVPSQQTGMFGKPSGKAGTIWATLNTQSGTTSYMHFELKPASTIQVRVYASSSAIENIYSIRSSSSLITDMGGPVTFLRLQSVFMRKLADKITNQNTQNYGSNMNMKQIINVGENISMTAGMASDMTNAKEISITAYVTAKTTYYLDFEATGLEEGVYYVYPMVGLNIVTQGQETQYGYQSGPIVKYNFASLPVEQYVVLGKRETKHVEFTLGQGVNISGSITRPQTGVETISIVLKKPSGEDIEKYKIVFTTTTQYNTTNSFKFEKVSAGRYILVAWSQNYKIYSKEILVGLENYTVPTIQLSKGATLIGYLKDDSGKAITSGVLVECESYPSKEGSYRNTDMDGMSISTETLTAGKFAFKNLPGGTYIIKVSAKADADVIYTAFSKAGITVPDSQVETDAGIIKLGNGTTISGKVLADIFDQSNGGTYEGPISGVRVLAYPQNSQQRVGIKLEAATDADGIFVIKGINTNIKSWEIVVNARQDDSTKQNEVEKMYGKVVKSNIDTSREDKDSIEVKLPSANAVVKGKVIAANLIMPFRVPGVDVDDFPAALILLQSAKDLSTGDPMAGAKMITSPDGTFEIKGIVPGSYTLKVFSKGYATYSQVITVAEGENDAGDITLVSGLMVSGTIRTQVGSKISSNDISIIVAATKNFAKVVFGTFVTNPVTLEIDRYSIIGLEPTVQYYIVLVNPETGKVVVDPTFVVLTDTDVTKDIIYRQTPPQFEAKGSKFTMPKMFLAMISDFDSVDLTKLPLGNDAEVFIIKGFATEPLRETTISAVVSTKAAAGQIVILSKAEQNYSNNRKEIALFYFPAVADRSRDLGEEGGNFVLTFRGSNSDGIVGETDYRFYLGGEGRSEKIMNPMIGGSVELGGNDNDIGYSEDSAGDQSGIEMPSGVEIQDDPNTPEDESEIAITSGTKVSVAKYTPEGVATTALRMTGKAAQKFRIMADPANYPGQIASSIYDLQVRLISGPLATIAQDKPITVKLQISSTTKNVIPIGKENTLKVYHQDDNSGNWVQETGDNVNIDWQNSLISIGVTHLSKFAAFIVEDQVVIPPVTGAVADLSNVKVYPNPAKYTSGSKITFANLTAKVKIRIYNIAGELIRIITEDEIGNSGKYEWNYLNSGDSGKVIASGIYIYLINNTASDAAGVTKKLGKVAVIK